MSLCNSSEATMYPERQLKYHQSLIQPRKINHYLKKKCGSQLKRNSSENLHVPKLTNIQGKNKLIRKYY